MFGKDLLLKTLLKRGGLSLPADKQTEIAAAMETPQGKRLAEAITALPADKQKELLRMAMSGNFQGMGDFLKKHLPDLDQPF